MQKHTAYNLTTGEFITVNRANNLKRLVALHTANDREWAQRFEEELQPHRWVFAHGNDFDDCVAKLTARGIWG